MSIRKILAPVDGSEAAGPPCGRPSRSDNGSARTSWPCT